MKMNLKNKIKDGLTNLNEAEYEVDKDDLRSFKGTLNSLLDDDDVIKIVDETDSIEEGVYSNIMKGVRDSSGGPFSLVVIDKENKKVIQQELVKIPQAIPAGYSVLRKEYPTPRYMISIEDNSGSQLFLENFINSKLTKNELINLVEGIKETNIVKKVKKKNI